MAIVEYFFGSALSLAGQECYSGNNLGRLVKRVVKAGRHSLMYISILEKMSGKQNGCNFCNPKGEIVKHIKERGSGSGLL